MEKYVFVKSSDCVNYYPDNKPYDFKIHLENVIDLHGYWKIGITEFFTMTTSKKKTINPSTNKAVITYITKPLFVHSDVCDFSSVRGYMSPLLRIIHADPSFGWNEKFYPVYYIPLRVSNISDIHIYLRDDTDSNATFIDSDVWITLHLIRYPF